MPISTEKCLSAKGLTKVFGIGNQKCVAVDHVDIDHGWFPGCFVPVVWEPVPCIYAGYRRFVDPADQLGDGPVRVVHDVGHHSWRLAVG